MTIVAIVDPPGAFIEGMAIQSEIQGTGLGRAEYEDWERKLPIGVEFITLRAVPTSEGFWLRLGFSSLGIEGDPLMLGKVRSLLEIKKMSKCISDSTKECINPSCGMLRWCAEVKTKTNEEPVKCGCEVCEMGIPQPREEWLKNPLHKQIHERIMAALASGEIQVQGAMK